MVLLAGCARARSTCCWAILRSVEAVWGEFQQDTARPPNGGATGGEAAVLCWVWARAKEALEGNSEDGGSDDE